MWQDNSRQLAIWICEAKLHCSLTPNYSWTWPPSAVDPPLSNSEPSTEKGDTEWEPNSSAEDTTLVEAAEPSSQQIPAHTPTPISSTALPARVARAFRASAEQDSTKRSRDISPFDSSCDGSDANKKQLVLWQPTAAQLLEQREALAHGEVESHHPSTIAPPSVHPRYNVRTSHTTISTVPATSGDPRIRSAQAIRRQVRVQLKSDRVHLLQLGAGRFEGGMMLGIHC
jgi:hypothetical protein